jgi:hypothetical protein
MGKMRVVCRVLVEKPEENRRLGILRRRCQDLLRWVFRKWDVEHGLDLSG